MKLHIPSALMLIIMCASGFAQEADRPSPGQTSQTPVIQTTQTTPPFNMKGKLGLFLYSNSNFSPSNFVGGSIGAKYFLFRNIAVRGGLTIINTSLGNGRQGFDFNNREGNPGEVSGDNIDQLDRGHRGAVATTFGANVYAMYYPVSIGKVHLYTGAGVMYDLTKGGRIIVNGVQLNDPQQKLFGVGGLAGAEYNVMKKLNLTLEYNPTFVFDNKKNGSEQLETINGIRIPRQQNFNATNFNVGAVYYFN